MVVHPEELGKLTFDFKDTELHRGFVNSKSNSGGLQAEFYKPKTGAYVECTWSNNNLDFQGFPGIVHGGILASLSDELMASAILAKESKFAVTMKANIQWKRPCKIGDQISGRANVAASISNFRLVDSWIFDSKGRLLLVSQGVFYLPTWEVFKRLIGVTVPEEIRSYLR